MDSSNEAVASSITNSRIEFNEASGDGGGIGKKGRSLSVLKIHPRPLLA